MSWMNKRSEEPILSLEIWSHSLRQIFSLKSMFSKKATKFWRNAPLDLNFPKLLTPTGKFRQIFVDFLENLKFNTIFKYLTK